MVFLLSQDGGKVLHIEILQYCGHTTIGLNRPRVDIGVDYWSNSPSRYALCVCCEDIKHLGEEMLQDAM